MGPDREPQDPVGAETLERLAGARNYNRWLTDRLQRWVGRRGLGNGAGVRENLGVVPGPGGGRVSGNPPPFLPPVRGGVWRPAHPRVGPVRGPPRETPG